VAVSTEFIVAVIASSCQEYNIAPSPESIPGLAGRLCVELIGLLRMWLTATYAVKTIATKKTWLPMVGDAVVARPEIMTGLRRAVLRFKIWAELSPVTITSASHSVDTPSESRPMRPKSVVSLVRLRLSADPNDRIVPLEDRRG